MSAFSEETNDAHPAVGKLSRHPSGSFESRTRTRPVPDDTSTQLLSPAILALLFLQLLSTTTPPVMIRPQQQITPQGQHHQRHDPKIIDADEHTSSVCSCGNRWPAPQQQNSATLSTPPARCAGTRTGANRPRRASGGNSTLAGSLLARKPAQECTPQQSGADTFAVDGFFVPKLTGSHKRIPGYQVRNYHSASCHSKFRADVFARSTCGRWSSDLIVCSGSSPESVPDFRRRSP